MVALALPRRNKESASRPSTPLTDSPPSTAHHVQSASLDPELAAKQPKRSSSFGKGLGLASLTNSMSRAGDVMHGFGRNRSGASTPSSPALASPASETVNGAASILGGPPSASMGPPATPDPSHLTQFSLKLSDLVNKAFVPCASGAAPSQVPGMAAGMAGAAKSAASGHGAFHGVPKIQNIAYEGKRLPDKVKILEIAHTVVGELRYAESVDPYLLRAVSRQILKALTLFAARIDSLLVSPTKDPQALRIPTNPKEGTHLPPALEFNIGLVTLEWIVEDSLERCIEGDRDAQGELIADEHGNVLAGMPHFVSEILTPVRKKMEGTILHVIQPLLAQTKASLTRCISAAVPSPFVNPINLSPSLTPGASASMNEIPGAAPATVPGNASPPQKAADVAASGPIASDGLSSAWLRELEARLEGIRRMLVPRIEERCGQDGEGWFISVAIHVIWKGLLILTSRSVALPSSDTTASFALGSVIQQVTSDSQKRTPSPAQLTQALKSVGMGVTKPKAPKDGSGSVPESGRQTPSQLGAPLSSDHAKLPPISQVSRKHVAHQIAELQAFEKLLVRFCEGFLRKSTGTQKKAKLHRRAKLPFFASQNQSTDLSLDLDDYNPDDEDELARAALAEAMHALKSTIIVLQTTEKEPRAICAALEQMAGGDADEGSGDYAPSLTSEAARALDAIPNLPLAQLLYNRLPLGIGRLELPTPPAIFGYTWSEYERAIAGFAGGQTWAQALAVRMKPEVEAAWPVIARREAERIASLEKVAKQAGTSVRLPFDSRRPDAAATGRGLPRSRSGARASTLAVSTLPPAASSSTDPSDAESDTSVQIDETMTQSVPNLDHKSSDLGATHGSNKPARSSDTDLSSSKTPSPSDEAVRFRDASGATSAGLAAGGDDTVGGVTASPPPMSPNVLAGDVAGKVASAGEVKASVPPKFWRRSSSNSKSGFHLALSSLSRSSSPKPRGRATSGGSSTGSASDNGQSISSNSAIATGTGAGTGTATANAAGAAAAAAGSGVHGIGGAAGFGTDRSASVSSQRTDASADEADDLARSIDAVRREAELERKSLTVFARALEYVSQGQVAIVLDPQQQLQQR
ncbi:uncharacterized protein PFL1_01679 [Pseudozyma flocculosa PF-1]|uniref:uncharacterized protein n=1 Tax=Pseudozyma flocculosa PF-1 TaxID=1277687 RepID=UPI00045611E5|nr:uncharacterized protein PFL1_01679 [Pseudozyma flocculosa PF-1]EPQ30778.1 hypothetical protein PFL1_01679 [Pseudozyma flocculosa PF-1]